MTTMTGITAATVLTLATTTVGFTNTNVEPTLPNHTIMDTRTAVHTTVALGGESHGRTTDEASTFTCTLAPSHSTAQTLLATTMLGATLAAQHDTAVGHEHEAETQQSTIRTV